MILEKVLSGILAGSNAGALKEILFAPGKGWNTTMESLKKEKILLSD